MRYEVLEETVIGAGGFLRIRRMRLRVVVDGRVSDEGLYDMVERPVGLDAVVVCLWLRRADGVIEVLLRRQPRVPLVFSRSDGNALAPVAIYEVVAGILEEGDSGIETRAAAEILEEAGITVEPSHIETLGPPSFPTPGMCGERFHFCSAEVTESARSKAVTPTGDGSPFEVGAALVWMPLPDALTMCGNGDIVDLKTEVTLRRLAERRL